MRVTRLHSIWSLNPGARTFCAPNALHINTVLLGGARCFVTIFHRHAEHILSAIVAQSQLYYETLVTISATNLLSATIHKVEVSPHARLCELKQKLADVTMIPHDKMVSLATTTHSAHT